MITTSPESRGYPTAYRSGGTLRGQASPFFLGRGGSSPIRGGGFYRGRASPFRVRSSGGNPPGRDILSGLVQKPLKSIRRGETPAMPDIVMKDVQYLASYNWIEAQEPTIIVPGSPRVWLDKPVPFKVLPDSGDTFIDQNGHRMPTCPFVPLFRAVDFMEEERTGPKFDWTSADIVTDRNCLRKLLAFAEGGDGEFRIDIQLAGPWTVLFHRWEERAVESSEGTGFGNSFERRSTAPAPGCQHGTLAGHYRIITYDFAGLKLVLRCEVDACYPSKKPMQGGSTSGAARSSAPLEELVDAISSMGIAKTISPRCVTEPVRKTGGVHIIRGGVEVSQSALIKVKTRSARNIASFKWGDVYVQQFIGQIPTQIIGVHTSGNFYEIQEKKLDAPEFKAVASEAQKGLKKLHHVLEEIHNFAMAHGRKARLSLVCKDGVLQVMQRESADSYLPSDVLKRFDPSQ